LGATFVGLTGIAEGQGLAGGAMVFSYGLGFAFFAFLVAIFLVSFLQVKTVVRINLIMFLALSVAIGILFLRNPNGETSHPETPIPDSPKTEPTSMKLVNLPANLNQNMGLGFFKPDFVNHQVLYFYGNLNFEKPISDHSPIDSIGFIKTEYGGYVISFAPPYFFPDHLKLDYDILLLKIISVGDDFVEVIVNKETQKTLFLNKYAGQNIYWPEFLLQVFDIEFLDEYPQQVKYKPLVHASEVNLAFSFMHPEMLQDKWMKVALYNDDNERVGDGWIQWRNDNELMISYSLLS
jgi:hypothetical protein